MAIFMKKHLATLQVVYEYFAAYSYEIDCELFSPLNVRVYSQEDLCCEFVNKFPLKYFDNQMSTFSLSSLHKANSSLKDFDDCSSNSPAPSSEKKPTRYYQTLFTTPVNFKEVTEKPNDLRKQYAKIQHDTKNNDSVNESTGTQFDISLETSFLEHKLEKYQEATYKDQFIDTHCHLDFLFSKLKFNGSLDSFIKNATGTELFPKSYGGCIAIFCKPLTFKKASWWKGILSSKKVWAAFGCHPHFSDQFGTEEEVYLRLALLNCSKVVALGEIGLDFSGRNSVSHDIQESVFCRQILLAIEAKKPIVIHCRDAFPLCFKILKEMLQSDYTIHVHCFTGTWEEAKEWLSSFTNLYLGFTCLVTQDSYRAKRVRDVIKKVPMKRILLETDAPYFRPKQVPSSSVNMYSNPGFALYVAMEIAEIKGIPIDDVISQTRRNTKAVYSI